MPIDFPTFRKAALMVVRDLLMQDFNRAEIEKATTPAQKLKAAIGLGGGHTLGDECPPYFLFSYKPTCELKLTRKTPSGYESTLIPRTLAFALAAEVLAEQQPASKQLTLF